MYQFVNDSEMSGLCPIRNDIIDFCLLVIDEKRNVVDEFRRQVQPDPHTWDYDAEKIHGYSFEQAMSFMERRKFCIELLHFLVKYKDAKNKPMDLIIHANPDRFFSKARSDWSWPMIDYHFLEWAFRKENLQWSFWKVFSLEKVVSTIVMAREHTGVHRGHTLDFWAKQLNYNLNHHEVVSDTYFTLELYKYFMEHKCTNFGIINSGESISLDNESKVETNELSFGL